MDLYERYRRAQLFAEAGDVAEVARLLEPVVAAEPGHTDARLRLALAYFGSARLELARGEFSTLVDQDPGDHYARHLLGRTLERLGRLQEALPHLRLAAAMCAQPEYAQAVERVGTRLAGSGGGAGSRP